MRLLCWLRSKKHTVSQRKVFVDLELSEEQTQICKELENSDRNFFITGRAGTGKTVVLQHFVGSTNKSVVKLAPTGIAAMNMRGQTIHSFFKFKPSLLDPNSIQSNPQLEQLVRNLNVIIIDEISMVRADMIDAIDVVLQKARRSEEAFGGIQIVMFGDLHQLPPVVESKALARFFDENYGGYYFFNARVWKNTPLSYRNLTTVFRQKDTEFKAILDAIRAGKPTEFDLTAINERLVDKQNLPPDGTIVLTTTNSNAEAINTTQLAALQTKSHTYHAQISGTAVPSSFPTSGELLLKTGAQVMFLKNDSLKRWVNGTIGTVKKMTNSEVQVQVGGQYFTVEPETWQNYRYTYDAEKKIIEQELASTFTQIPLKHAWAITIHKSQGCSYSKAVIDLGSGAFSHGQAYVALSRCRSLEGLYLQRQLRKEDIIVNQDILDFVQIERSSSV